MLPAIEVVAGSIQDMQAAFSFIYSAVEPSHFALTLFSPEKEIKYSTGWFEDFMFLLAHCRYLREDSQRIVFIGNGTQVSGNSTEWVSQLQSICSVNGFSFTPIWLDKNPVSGNEVSGTNFPGLVWRYTNRNEMERMLTTAVAPVTIYIQTDGIVLENLYTELDQLVNYFKSCNPVQYQLLLQLTTDAKEKHSLQQKLREYTTALHASQQYQALWLQETPQQETIGTGGVIHQVNRIKRFYWEEYEVLPLWYKRLGHVIKVITGKRTFRSLFRKKGN
ncbi:MAG: hypothetical protein BGO54_16565 [Sphingobacteriales bacterium 46-32]|nr:MAG: hypothetical protein BGO54_16565 [Sphingobacteriales bacterium 46-32]